MKFICVVNDKLPPYVEVFGLCLQGSVVGLDMTSIKETRFYRSTQTKSPEKLRVKAFLQKRCQFRHKINKKNNVQLHLAEIHLPVAVLLFRQYKSFVVCSYVLCDTSSMQDPNVTR